MTIGVPIFKVEKLQSGLGIIAGVMLVHLLECDGAICIVFLIAATNITSLLPFIFDLE